MAAMKAMLEKLVKKSEEKKACIKLPKKKNARLTRKLEKHSIFPSKVRRRKRCLAKVKLLTKRFTQRREVNSRTLGLRV